MYIRMYRYMIEPTYISIYIYIHMYACEYVHT